MAYNFVPTGTILPYGGVTPPSGWLFCDGSAVSRSIYSALFSSIATSWGYGDNSTTFNLPDLRGRFLRGYASGSSNDPDRSGRTACNTGGNTGDAVGSVQIQATNKNGMSVSGSVTGDGAHVHFTSQAFGSYNEGYYGTTGGTLPWGLGFGSYTAGGVYGGQTESRGHGHGLSVSLGAGDNETRPLNANVSYIIKV